MFLVFITRTNDRFYTVPKYTVGYLHVSFKKSNTLGLRSLFTNMNIRIIITGS